MNINKSYEFKGFDWTELPEALGIEAPPEVQNDRQINLDTGFFPDEDFQYNEVRNLLGNVVCDLSFCNKTERVERLEQHKDIIKTVKKFLKGFYKGYPSDATGIIAKAISKMDERNMLLYTMHNLTFLWT